MCLLFASFISPVWVKQSHPFHGWSFHTTD